MTGGLRRILRAIGWLAMITAILAMLAVVGYASYLGGLSSGG